MAAFGFEAAVLLDSDGTAVAGHDAVSDIVLSAARQEPVIAVAVPFDVGDRRRVLSGGYRLEKTPLTRFLEASSTLPGRKLYLVDGAGQVITSTEDQAGTVFRQLAPAFDAAPLGTSEARRTGVKHLVVAVPVEGTRWRLVAAVPTAELQAPVSGTKRMLWALVAATASMAVLVLVLLVRVSRQRDHLGQINRTDKLTGLARRRQGAGSEDVHRVTSGTAASTRTLYFSVPTVDRPPRS